jgi:hypothetical protein
MPLESWNLKKSAMEGEKCSAGGSAALTRDSISANFVVGVAHAIPDHQIILTRRIRLMLFRTAALGFTAVASFALAGSAVAATKIRIDYSYSNERIRPNPQTVHVHNSFDITLNDGGGVNEEINRRGGRATDRFKTGTKLGRGQWNVIGANHLRRTIPQPQSTLVVNVTTSGNSCNADIKWILKPGFQDYKFKQIRDQSWAFFNAPRVEQITCRIQ